ncbi:MAG: phosphate ABC transporter permease PstA [Clostridiales Family XIII bacterium]|jgi:phosphate transport system permease protein|nr:phosphate ABC transporter permease PstA [Clostridiales Family XIII bacterium]
MKLSTLFLRLITYFFAGLTSICIIGLISYILIKGIPNLSPSLFAIKYTSENSSLFPAFISTLIITVLSLLLALPIGVFSAIFLVEYSKKGNPFVKFVRLATETLAGIPSIVYGLFGMLTFVLFLGFGYSILSGALTLAIMILPLIIRTTEESLLTVPDSFREGSFGLGAGRLRTVFAVVLPSAIPGILAGVILATGRIVGESAALIFTAGTAAKMPTELFSSARTLSVHMYALSSEGLHIDKAYGTAVFLLIIVLLINILAGFLASRLSKLRGGEK